MTHDELLAKIDQELETDYADPCGNFPIGLKALRAVVNRHEPFLYPENDRIYCMECNELYRCPTIQDIEKELR